MAELADALDLGSSEATRVGSTPSTRTIFFQINNQIPLFCFRSHFAVSCVLWKFIAIFKSYVL